MEWIRSKDNPYFARAFVNRVWANYFGVGIVNPPDDMNLANPPSNAALLDYLADGFVDHEFDMKWLHREITGSLAYQRSWQANETNRLDERNFSRAVVRRLPAEVLIDAVTLATGNSKVLARASTEVDDRAIGPRSRRDPANRAWATTPPRSSAARPARPTATATARTSPTCSSRSTSRTTPRFSPPSTGAAAGSTRRPRRRRNAQRQRQRPALTANLTGGLEGVPLEQLEARLAEAKASNRRRESSGSNQDRRNEGRRPGRSRRRPPSLKSMQAARQPAARSPRSARSSGSGPRGLLADPLA